jgi:hypothetical protein
LKIAVGGKGNFVYFGFQCVPLQLLLFVAFAFLIHFDIASKINMNGIVFPAVENGLLIAHLSIREVARAAFVEIAWKFACENQF